MSEVFERTYQGQPTRTDPELLFWCLYEVIAERFDRTLPGSWWRDEWMPFDRSFSRRYASVVLRRVRELALKHGVEMQRSSGSCRATQRMSHEERERLLEREGPEVREMLNTLMV